jgi:putative nucleotidyltransferase with HDIG domain
MLGSLNSGRGQDRRGSVKKTSLPRSSPRDQQISLSDIIAPLSFALDLTEGACPGHAVRTCILGMRIGKAIGLDDAALDDLYYALLLKDVGCSSNASRFCEIVGDDEIHAKRLLQTADWTRLEWCQMHYLLRHAHARRSYGKRLRGISSMVRNSTVNAEALARLRCDKGATVVRNLGLGAATAGAIYCLDEHWNGQGYPNRIAGEDIPLMARIASIAQTFEVFYRLFGVAAAVDTMQRRSGRWFDPILVRVLIGLHRCGELLQGMKDDEFEQTAALLAPQQKRVFVDAYTIDNICTAFAGVVDAKSPYTYCHSNGVARIAQQIGQCMNLDSRQLTVLRRAALLHDIGKLSVPNSILDKPGKLDAMEWATIRTHTHYTYEILNRISGFGEIATIAAQHHEKLDGSGYHLGLRGDQISLSSRILTVADMFDALCGERPYRERLTLDQIYATLRKETPHAIDPECFEALLGVSQQQVVA